MKTVGSYEAKTHLARLLDRVARGEEFQITRHGRPIARLVPEPEPNRPDVGDVITQIKQFRKGRKLGAGLSVRDLIEEGRRS